MGVESLLRPRSIAIVGASDRIGPGFNAWNALRFVGYEGLVHLVNPRRPELFGHATCPSLDAIPDAVDAVFVAVGADAVLDVARQAADKGAGALTILSSGFGETEDGADAQAELTRIAGAAGMAVCGPNCLGLLNFTGSAALFGTSLPDQVQRGGIAAIVQSGSIGIALLNSARGLGFSHLVTTGNEAVTTAADYIEALLDDPAVTTLVVFAEQIKKPAAFLAALRRARALGKPVIVLKSGRSASGQAAVMAHTGAVAGSVEATDAALRAAGAIQVHTLDDLIETALLVSTLRRAPSGQQVGAMSLSGGEIALVLDAAEEVGLRFAPLGRAEAPIRALLPPFAHLANPLDLTWAGLYEQGVAQGCAAALGRQDDIGLLLLIQDAPTNLGPQQAQRYATLLRGVAAGAAEAGVPLVALSNLSDQPHPLLAETAGEHGVAYLRGTRAGLAAIARYAAWAGRPEAAAPETGVEAEMAPARQRLAVVPPGELPAEHVARAILASYGVSGPRERLVGSAEAAVSAAIEIGFPIVLKGVVANLVHKSDAGLVRVGLRSADEVWEAADAMLVKAAALGSRVDGLLVQEKAAPVAEIFVGARIDPDFGPLIVVGAGGVQVELYRDVAVRLAPIGDAEALEALMSTKVSRLLQGFRGAPPADVAAAARTIAALSRFLVDFADEIAEVEINPLALFPDGQGCSALDCVIIPKGYTG